MTPEEYLRAVESVASRAAKYLPADRLGDVHRLIDHGEPAEGMRSLAWVIVAEQVDVPDDLIDSIELFTVELIDEASMPANLREFSSFDV